MTELERIRLARVALSCLVEPGNQIVHQMVVSDGPATTLHRVIDGDLPDDALRGAIAARLRGGDPHAIAEDALRRAARLGARIAIPEEEDWPRPVEELVRLAQPGAATRVDRDVFPPTCLWVRGGRPLAETLDRSVAVVGSRAATAYGKHVATELGYGLADRGWAVVSGGAFGVDAAAHRGALTAGGVTVAVLACGMDRPYPLGHAALFDRIADSGLLITEWPPGAEPFRHRFLVRNRVIAAATRGTVVVEAAARSGARQTLGRALGLDRHSMVVPGPVTSAMSVGCHELLRTNPDARLVAGVEHVLEEVGRIGEDLAPVPRGPERAEDRLGPAASQVLEALHRRRSVGLDEVAARAGVDIRTAMRQLSLLDELGLVARKDGDWMLAPRRQD
jgi:DNA processing protein